MIDDDVCVEDGFSLWFSISGIGMEWDGASEWGEIV